MLLVFVAVEPDRQRALEIDANQASKDVSEINL